MQKPKFVENKIYHIYNRGVEKRKTFLDKQDYLRFIHNLFEFNDEAATKNLFFYFNRLTSEVEPHYLKPNREPRKLLVNILAFCLMPNHFHLLVQQIKENGVVRFMQKLGTGYTMYFNQKYERVGGLFQGRFKAVLVENEAHFIHLPYYIHCNPLDLAAPEWREREIKDYKKAMRFLENYRWSSHLDYMGKKNFPSVTQRDFLLEFFEGTKGYEKGISTWLETMELEEFNHLILE